LIDSQVQASASYRQWQPFGQVPAYKDDDVEMFESGAIVLHIVAKSEALTPSDEAGRQLGDHRAQFHRAARAEFDSLRRRDLGERDLGETRFGRRSAERMLKRC
jgi:glutathione S-transferase